MINESALVRAMKREYKGLGYDITNATDRLYICGPVWFVEMPWKSVPGKVLGMIAEHLRGMPAPGETIHLQSGEEPQVVLEDVAADDLARWLDTKIPESGGIERTMLQAGNLVIFQDPQFRKCYGLPDYVADIVEDAGTAAEGYEGGRYRWWMEDGIVTAMCYRPENPGGTLYATMLRLWQAMEAVDLLTK